MDVPKDNWEIDPQRTAVVVIDMQRFLLDPDSPRNTPGARDLVPKINELNDMCRRLGMPVIWVLTIWRPDMSDIGLLKDFRPEVYSEWWSYEGKKGSELYKDLDRKEGDYDVKKIMHSAFAPGSSSLEPLLRGLGRDSLIICGIATDVCVLTTTSGAHMQGFKTFVVGDLTTTFTQERQKVGLEVLNMHFAKVMTFEKVQRELKQR